MSHLPETGFHFPDQDELVRSSFESVGLLDPSVLESLANYKSGEPWGVGDAFTVNSSGVVTPTPETTRYKRSLSWEAVPDDPTFRSSYLLLRDSVIRDAQSTLNSTSIHGVVEVKHTGPEPSEEAHYDQVPHLDVVSLLGQRVLLYLVANKETTRLYTGWYKFAGFVDDYSKQPDFNNVTEHRPEPNELIRAEGITLLHAGSTPAPNRLFVRGFVEAAEV